MDEGTPFGKARAGTQVVLSEEGLFRHHVVSEIRTRVLGGKRPAAAIREVLALPHVQPAGRPRPLAARTLYRWLASFSAEGYPGLEPERRPVIAGSAVLPRRLLDFLRLIKQDENECYTSLPELIRRARLLGVVAEDEAIDRTSVWRA